MRNVRILKAFEEVIHYSNTFIVYSILVFVSVHVSIYTVIIMISITLCSMLLFY